MKSYEVEASRVHVRRGIQPGWPFSGGKTMGAAQLALLPDAVEPVKYEGLDDDLFAVAYDPTPTDSGWYAGWTGESSDTNPYTHTRSRHYWFQGWRDGIESAQRRIHISGGTSQGRSVFPAPRRTPNTSRIEPEPLTSVGMSLWESLARLGEWRRSLRGDK